MGGYDKWCDDNKKFQPKYDDPVPLSWADFGTPYVCTSGGRLPVIKPKERVYLGGVPVKAGCTAKDYKKYAGGE